ncbi:AraC family transcriptional regulator [Agriterribacter sp.]|uniref:AraC family transcriptional regulator n=1 Tax=Agriterribacter sp. TaxID=2821509 RepID=UPI002D1B81A8|nr:AraC family transcriptional regulator [Agriterribacter sp.]HRP57026.1 AraC family transcriptional regulator [Agriterribacter sp.]
MNNFIKYLTVSDVEENWGLYVRTVGYSSTKPHWQYPITEGHPRSHLFTWDKGRRLNGYYLVFISKGGGIFETETTGSEKISEGTVFFLFPDIWHRYKPDKDTGWDEYWVGFDGYYARKLMDSGFFSAESCVVQIGLNQSALVIFHKMMEAVQKAHAGYHQFISSLVLQLLSLTYYASAFGNRAGSENSFYISKAKFIMQESIEGNLSLQQLAERLMVSYSKFRQDFKKVTGLSPNQYLLGLRIRKAKELLQSTSLSMSEVAALAGFDSVYYFSKFFKKSTGTSPSLYRKKLIEEYQVPRQ